MQLTFYGAVREVTGSMHLLSTDRDRILLDCGMFQGRRKEAFEKNRIMPLDPAGLTNVEVRLVVTDTETGQVQEYRNNSGTAFQPIQDTQAFATCF